MDGQAGSIPAEAGIGLRFPHHAQVLQQHPAVPWFEVHAENYFGGGAVRRTLEAVRRDYPLSLHGVVVLSCQPTPPSARVTLVHCPFAEI